VDLLIIGGGINGTGIACDAAGRGLSVHLCEQNDLASGTSSKSTKLIHGGLRYLEYYEFRLVHEALKEREILLRKAPHLIRPLSFILPHHSGLRPAWLIRLGLFLYDHLARRSLLPASKTLSLMHNLYGQPLKPTYKKGFMYPDCWVDDARLVISNAMSAQEKGAHISPYCTVVHLHRFAKYWEAQVVDARNHRTFTITARAVVNATGPWMEQFLKDNAQLPSHALMHLVKGSHIVIPKLYEGDHAYILQQTDQRVVFAIPYEQHWTLVGTTEIDYTGDPAIAAITNDEVLYLCQIINTYFKKSIDATQVVWSFSGVRPLFDKHKDHDAKSLSRDYAFELTDAASELPLLSILGGKITTYRRLAEHALEKLRPYFKNMGPAWTANVPLPGGDINHADFNHFFTQLQNHFPNLPLALLYRLAHQYGTRIYAVLEDARYDYDLGLFFGATLYQREVDYLKTHEWLYKVEDLLYRRTKLALELTNEQIIVLKAYIEK
jgi:glycerol-3-phosphate dehydrogenase